MNTAAACKITSSMQIVLYCMTTSTQQKAKRDYEVTAAVRTLKPDKSYEVDNLPSEVIQNRCGKMLRPYQLYASWFQNRLDNIKQCTDITMPELLIDATKRLPCGRMSASSARRSTLHATIETVKSLIITERERKNKSKKREEERNWRRKTTLRGKQESGRGFLK